MAFFTVLFPRYTSSKPLLHPPFRYGNFFFILIVPLFCCDQSAKINCLCPFKFLTAWFSLCSDWLCCGGRAAGANILLENRRSGLLPARRVHQCQQVPVKTSVRDPDPAPEPTGTVKASIRDLDPEPDPHVFRPPESFPFLINVLSRLK